LYSGGCIKGINGSFMQASGFMFYQEKTAKGNKIIYGIILQS